MLDGDRVGRDDQSTIRLPRKLRDSALNLGGIVYTQRTQLDLKWRCGGLGRAQVFEVVGRFQMQHECNAGNMRRNFIEDRHPFFGDRVLKSWKSSKVPAGSCNVCDEATANRV